MIVSGSPEDLDLAGIPDGIADVALTLRAGERPDGAETWVVWAADAATAAAAAGADRVMAPAGGALWRRAPWPVRDELFELVAPATRAGGVVTEAGPNTSAAGRVTNTRRNARAAVVVAEGGHDTRAATVAALGERGIDASESERLTVEAIRAGGVVVLLGDGHLPAAGMAVPATGRLLVTVDCQISFGLVPGIDHLAADSAEAAAALVDVTLGQWDALVSMRKLGRRAAERHRASHVYRRVLEDLAIETASGTGRATAG